MLDELNTDVGQDQNIAAPELGEMPNQPPVERTFTQRDVGAIVARERAQAAEKARARALAEQQQSSMGGMKQLSSEEIERLVGERVNNQFQQKQMEYDKAMHEQRAHQTVDSYLKKIEMGRQTDPDFDSTFKDLDFAEISDLVPLINNAENSYLVTKELVNNPEKIAQLRTLLHTPGLAMRVMGKLSASISANQNALNQQRQSVNDPLSQINPSTVGTDNGSMSVKDYKQQPWLRG